MSSLKSNGIILKEKDFKESDKILTVLLKNYGKVTIYARGAKKTNSKFLAGSQVFSYSEYVVHDGGNFLSLTSIDLIKNFYYISSDFEKLSYGYYFLEITDKVLMENMESDSILFLLLQTLSSLNNNIISNKLIYTIFNLKFLQLNGYTPIMDYCHNCNKQEFYPKYFSGQGITCGKCKGQSPYSFAVDDSLIYTLNFILNSELKNLYSFEVNNKILSSLMKITKKSNK